MLQKGNIEYASNRLNFTSLIFFFKCICIFGTQTKKFFHIFLI